MPSSATPARPYVSAEMVSAGLSALMRASKRRHQGAVVVEALALPDVLPAIYRAMLGAKVSTDRTAAERQRRSRAKRREA